MKIFQLWSQTSLHTRSGLESASAMRIPISIWTPQAANTIRSSGPRRPFVIFAGIYRLSMLLCNMPISRVKIRIYSRFIGCPWKFYRSSFTTSSFFQMIFDNFTILQQFINVTLIKRKHHWTFNRLLAENIFDLFAKFLINSFKIFSIFPNFPLLNLEDGLIWRLPGLDTLLHFTNFIPSNCALSAFI